MATLRLRPGPLFFYDSPAGYRWRAPASIPSGAIWADDADSTFMDIATDEAAFATEAVSADFETLPPNVTSVLFRARWQWHPLDDLGDTGSPSFFLDDADTDEHLAGTQYGFGGYPYPSTPTWDDSFYLGEEAAPRFSGRNVRLSVYDVDHIGTKLKFRVFEAELVITYDGARFLAPLRQDLCRDDVARVWPVSSQQASLRRLGGYY